MNALGAEKILSMSTVQLSAFSTSQETHFKSPAFLGTLPRGVTELRELANGYKLGSLIDGK